MATITTPLRYTSAQAKATILTGLRYTSTRSGETITTGLRYTTAQAKATTRTGLRYLSATNGVWTGLRYTSAKSVQSVSTGLRYTSAQAVPTAFVTARKTGIGDLSVTFSSSTGGSAALCQTHTLVIAQQESQTQTFSLQIDDASYEWHPGGTGSYKDVMAAGAEVSINVSYGGLQKQFFGKFKSPQVSRGGGRNVPVMAWPGLCVANDLFQSKKTLATAGVDPFATRPTNRSLLTEACEAAGVESDWSGIRNMRVLGPVHRQNLRPGEMLGKFLAGMSIDEWRTDYKTIVGYDPTKRHALWVYDPDDGDVVFSHDIQPLDNDEYTKVVVIRAIKTGDVQAYDEETVEIPVEEFGQYPVTFNPPVSGIHHRMAYGAPEGVVSDILCYKGNELVAVRVDRGNYWPGLATGRTWEIDRVVFTWGAANVGITRRGIRSAKGGVIFTGRPHNTATVGNGLTRNDPLDTTTRLVVGSGDAEIELPPNPLLYNAADMQYHGEKYLARVGAQQVNHTLKVPLNPAIELGDTVRLMKDRWLGGSGYYELKVTGYSHAISVFPQNRYTTLNCVEFS